MRAGRAFEVVARLKPGVTMEAAQAELGVIADRLAREYPEANKGTGVVVEPIRAGIVGSDLQTTSMFLLGVVGFVLLLCCANVANLLLARATARAREIAVRSALGAERGRIIRQLLTESLVLAVFGGALGIGVGAAILGAAPALIPPGLLPAAVTPAFDVRVVVFGLAAALAVGVVFGVIPAWQATGASLAGVMAAESRSATSTGSRTRRLLVSGEVARGGRAPVRRRAVAADAAEAGRRRHRLSLAGRVGPDARLQRAYRQELTLSDRRSGDAVLRCGGPRRQRAARGPPRRLGVQPAVRHERARTVGVRDRRRSAGRRSAIDRPRSTRPPIPDTSRRSICRS